MPDLFDRRPDVLAQENKHPDPVAPDGQGRDPTVREVGWALRLNRPYGKSCVQCVMTGHRKERGQKRCREFSIHGCSLMAGFDGIDRCYGCRRGSILAAVRATLIVEHVPMKARRRKTKMERELAREL